jgi:hypothetical protein
VIFGASEAALGRSSPHVVVLSEADRRLLQARARSYTATHAEVVRSKIVLLAADGLANTVIAGLLDVHVDVVSKWRQRFCWEGLAGLVDPSAAVGRRPSATRWWPRSRRWRVSRRSSGRCR